MILKGKYKYQLTPKEFEVLKVMYKSTPEIVEELGLPYGTVKSRIDRIMEKVEAKNRTQAIVKSLLLGYVKLDDLEDW